MKTARLIWKRDTDPDRAATRCLWHTSDGAYIVTSSVRISEHQYTDAVVSETMTFPADDTGNVTDWEELGVSAYDDHEGALRAAGYEVV